MTPGPRQYAELHLHLGGAVLPRILYTQLQRAKQDRANPGHEIASQYLQRWPTYEKFERRLTKPSDTLSKYLEAHKIVEPLQSIDNLAYYVNRLLRGCAIFENLSYLELRYNPYFRVAKEDREGDVRSRMQEIVATVAAAAAAAFRDYPIVLSQILCMDSRLPDATNREILEVATSMPNEVCAVDLAGPDEPYREREEEFGALLKEAKTRGLNVTAHLFETPDGSIASLLDFVDRIGHGIQIPLREPRLLPMLAKRKICLEVCPTTYFRTGSLKSYRELAPVFRSCFDLGVDIAVCTDNGALHGVRLPLEFERLLTHGVIGFSQMEKIREAAFRHAFRWPGTVDRRDNRL
jgi:adenosine deaminase